MKLEFYMNMSDPRKAVKNIGEVIHTVNNAAIYRECSLMTPEFLIDYSPAVAACNYIYAGVTIDGTTYGAYYFIKDRIVMPGGRMVVVCSKDVLSTWWHRLKDCTANVIRQESEEHFKNDSRFIFDSNMVGKANTDFGNIPFSLNPFHIPTKTNEYCMLMTVLGGTPQTHPESGNQLQGGDENEAN